MQPRLTRSRTEVMVAGVCGGLGEYFGVDPTIVRFIFVIVMLTSGLSLPVYLVLWLVMPRASAPMVGGPPHTTQNTQNSGAEVNQFGQQVAQLGQQIGQEAAQFGQQISRELREVLVSQPRSQQQSRPAQSSPMPTTQQPPDPSMYNYDPITGQPVRPEMPSTGQTINLGSDPNIIKGQYVRPVVPPPPPVAARHQRKNWSTLGLMLVGIGGLILINQVFGSLDFVFPLVLIVAGIVMLRRR